LRTMRIENVGGVGHLEIRALDNAYELMEFNNAAVPDIGELTIHKAEWLVNHAVLPGLATLDGRPAGMMVVLSDTSGYDSDFYRWFTERYENFLYIDRIVVVDWARGQGVAKHLYESVDQAAQAKKLAVVADVYSEPPNVASLRLHLTRGFQSIGAQYFPDRNKTAAKFMKYVEQAKPKPAQTA
jgi:predicted GNAT superfamily acetyltransferase